MYLILTYTTVYTFWLQNMNINAVIVTTPSDPEQQNS